MKALFIKSYIPNSTLLDIKIGKGINVYEYNNSLYVLANTNEFCMITAELKENIEVQLKHLLKPFVFVSMFNSKKEYSKSAKEIAWGTYAWFADAPKHYIHFDDKPSAERFIARSALA